MASLPGRYHNVPYITRNMHNVNAKQRREGCLDAVSCLRYLRECKANDPALYYKEVVDGEGVLQHLFWCDGTSQIDYQVFGDVVAFDVTYMKNVYLSPLVVFSSVNHHCLCRCTGGRRERRDLCLAASAVANFNERKGSRVYNNRR
ncbi:hypothetical protein AHAS_Ahas02G0132200 [Arachis hypogaea]